MSILSKRRSSLSSLHLIIIVAASLIINSVYSLAPQKFVVFGGSGKTGSAVVKRIFSDVTDSKVICPVRNMATGRKKLGQESGRFQLIPCDIAKADKNQLESIVGSADAVIICSAYSPGGGKPDLKGSYKIDNLGAKRIIDACVAANVPKVVLLSSLLTNGFAAGQFLNPQYLLLNAFGGILIQKRQAEIYLEKQITIDYTIIRPGGLKDDPSSEPILYGSADTLFGGSISREQVAEVIVQSTLLSEASNKIVEIVATLDARVATPAQGLSSIR
jgi:nucleoside-diphosphate-sugar epimerase